MTEKTRAEQDELVSESDCQLPADAYSSRNVICGGGREKITPSLEDALRRNLTVIMVNQVLGF